MGRKTLGLERMGGVRSYWVCMNFKLYFLCLLVTAFFTPELSESLPLPTGLGN